MAKQLKAISKQNNAVVKRVRETYRRPDELVYPTKQFNATTKDGNVMHNVRNAEARIMKNRQKAMSTEPNKSKGKTQEITAFVNATNRKFSVDNTYGTIHEILVDDTAVSILSN